MEKQILEYLIRNPGKITFFKLFQTLGFANTVPHWQNFVVVLQNLCHARKLAILYKPKDMEPLGQNREVELNVAFLVEKLCNEV